jgi:hypothetical protein
VCGSTVTGPKAGVTQCASCGSVLQARDGNFVAGGGAYSNGDVIDQDGDSDDSGDGGVAPTLGDLFSGLGGTGGGGVGRGGSPFGAAEFISVSRTRTSDGRTVTTTTSSGGGTKTVVSGGESNGASIGSGSNRGGEERGSFRGAGGSARSSSGGSSSSAGGQPASPPGVIDVDFEDVSE